VSEGQRAAERILLADDERCTSLLLRWDVQLVLLTGNHSCCEELLVSRAFPSALLIPASALQLGAL